MDNELSTKEMIQAALRLGKDGSEFNAVIVLRTAKAEKSDVGFIDNEIVALKGLFDDERGDDCEL
jgi:hypothetical protein